MSEKHPIPPKWADRFLGWYCSPAVREQVQGDAHELFYWRLEEKGLNKARKAFMWDVVRLFKWANIKRSSQNQQLNNIAMFKNYFKIGLRNLWKQKMPSTINIIGLSLAIGCCIVSFKWIESRFIKDQFYDKTDEIYLVTPTRYTDGGDSHRFGGTAIAIADRIQDQIPGVENVVRHQFAGINIKAGDNDFPNNALFVDDNFLEVFSFRTLMGDPAALSDPRKIIMNERTANATFGDTYPIGEQVEIRTMGKTLNFEVGAVIEDYPDQSSLRPNVLINFSFYEQEVDDKLNTTVLTFIELNTSTEPQDIAEPLAALAKTKAGLTPDDPYLGLSLEPIYSVAAKNGTEIYDAMGGTAPMAPVIVLSCIGAFLLLLSTFNYVNISTVMAMKRVKEIGVRKVIGSRRHQLITQFLTENFILCSLAIVLGCLLASALFLPGFNNIAESSLSLEIMSHVNLWYFLGTLLFFITVASGAYPAFYISSFKPVNIFRGGSAKGGKRRLTGALLTFQMTLAIVTIMAGIMFVRTNKQHEVADWGYDQFDKLAASKPRGVDINVAMAELEKIPNVEEVAGSKYILGQVYSTETVKYDEREVSAFMIDCDYNYPDMMDLELVAGQFFLKETMSQNQHSLLVNEQFMKAMEFDLETPELVTIDSVNYNIIGVLKDYRYSGFSDKIQPAAFRVMPDSLFGSITVKFVKGTLIETQDAVKDVLAELNPDQVPYFRSQDSVFDNYFNEMRGISNIMIFTATLSVLLAAMGLFGLVSLSISSRIKDFSIKKVLGASFMQLSKDVYKRFAIILGLAVVIGGTLSVFVIGMLLDNVYNGNHEQIGVVPLALAGLLLLGVAALTINTQVLHVKRMNPADTLRTE